MNRISLLAGGLIFAAFAAYGQDYSGDVFRYSEQPIIGTARFQGLGGSHAALGGDASSVFTNPAGLGFYNRSEFSLSPGIRLQNVGATYLERSTSASSSTPFVGQAGLIFAGEPSRNGKMRRGTFGITYSRQVSLNNEFTFSGQNNRSSLTDSYAEELNRYGVASGTVDQAYNTNTKQIGNIGANTANELFGTAYLAAAYQLYLLDPLQTNGKVYAGAEQNKPTIQTQGFNSSGAQSQWALGYGANFDDKFYVGGSLALTSTRYDFTNEFRESFVGGDQIRGMADVSTLTVRGTGINLTLGAIYRPTQSIQLGATFASPTFSQLTETYNRTISADIIGIRQTDNAGNPVRFVPDLQEIDLPANDFEYSITTPLRASGGATFFVGKRGFLTATAEYVGYSGMRVSTDGYGSSADNQAFRQDNTRFVQGTYQSVVNFRAGAEVRADVFRFRLGAAYLPSPYKTTFDPLAQNGERDTWLYSGGVGARNDRFFADLAAVFYTTKTAYTPYTLNTPQNYGTATLNNKITSLMLSVGLFF